MTKNTPEQIAGRREEIVNACEKLYGTMSFKDITIREIGNEVPFSRPTIYNYFETKEEIFSPSSPGNTTAGTKIFPRSSGDTTRFPPKSLPGRSRNPSQSGNSC